MGDLKLVGRGLHVYNNALIDGTLNVVGAVTLSSTLAASSISTTGTFTIGGIAYTFPGSQANGAVLQTNGAGVLSWVSPFEHLALTDLSDATITTPLSGQPLVYNGAGAWVNSYATAITSVGTLSGLTVTATITGSISGNAATATNVAGTGITGTTLATGVITSSLTTVGILNAGSITSGFGAIDIGTDAISGGAFSFISSVTSITALATLGAMAATQGSFYASTVSGATLQGFGTTGDVTLKNRAGTDVVVVTANTLNVTMAGNLGVTGTISGTSLTMTLNLKSVTAFATPSTLSATAIHAFASTISGAALMGFGTTNDVSLMNRAGTVCLGVGPNTTTVNITNALLVSGGATIQGLTIGKGAGTIADNTTVGNQALFSNTTGSQATAIGYNALYSNTTGGHNTAVGNLALNQNATGWRNTAVGSIALKFTTGQQNIGLGSYAGAYETGSNALYVNSIDRSSTANDKTLSLIYGIMAAAAADQSITFNVGTATITGALTVSGAITGSISGNAATATNVAASGLTGTTMAAAVVTSSLTTVGALNAGSITSGFGSIDIGVDAITAGSISGTTGGFTGKLILQALGESFAISSSSTNAMFGRVNNGTAALLWGVESSIGGSLLVGGAAYASCLLSEGAYPLQFGTNNTLRFSISSTGAATFSSTLAVMGVVGIGGVGPSAGVAFNVVNPTLTGVSQFGIASQSAFSSGATTAGISGYFQLATAAAAFTMVTGYGIQIATPAIGAASAVTNIYGLYIANQTGGGTLNYAIKCNGGQVNLALPTSSAGLTAGSLWSNSGVVTVA